MKTAVHPETFQDAKVRCTSCGTVFAIPSTVKDQTVEVCRMCHPIYTGKEQQDLKGSRVERFRKRMASGKTPAKKK